MAQAFTSFERAVSSIVSARDAIAAGRSLVIGVSGIDGAGKGHFTANLVERLGGHGLHAVGINVNGWLNPPHVRFSRDNRAEHFYERAIRFDEMFEQLILPLKAKRSHQVVADFAEETASAYRKHTYAFDNVDVIAVEGIYLLKRRHRRNLDLSIWVECSFQTALERALARGQEGLPAVETIHAYESIYFPAQRIHLARDDPRAAADLIVINDPQLQLGQARVMV